MPIDRSTDDQDDLFANLAELSEDRLALPGFTGEIPDEDGPGDELHGDIALDVDLASPRLA